MIFVMRKKVKQVKAHNSDCLQENVPIVSANFNPEKLSRGGHYLQCKHITFLLVLYTDVHDKLVYRAVTYTPQRMFDRKLDQMQLNAA